MARYTAQKLPLHHALPPMLCNPTNVFEEKSGKELFSEGLETLSEEQQVFSVSLLRRKQDMMGYLTVRVVNKLRVTRQLGK